jgi:ribosomal protein S8
MRHSLIYFLINIKNHYKLRKEFLVQNFTNNFFKIVKLLYKEGFIQSYRILKIGFNTKIQLILRSIYNKSVINSICIISKPSNNVFLRYRDLTYLSSQNSIFILSTSKGLFTHTDCIKKKIGGKALFSIN